MIDWDRVAELRDEIGAEDFDDVLDLFLSEVETAVRTLENCAPIADVIEEHMHFIKGASLNLGFAGLAEVCRTGEKAAREGNPVAVPASEVREIFDSSRETFLRDYAVRFAA